MFPEAMPWYKSKVIIGALVSILSKILFATGVIGEMAEPEMQQLVDILVLVIGGIGDLVIMGARVAQKEAPAITVAKPRGSALSLMVCALMVPLLLSGCAATGLQSPGSISDQTKLDEQVGLTLTLAYTGASRLGTLGVKTGIIKGKANVDRFKQLDAAAYSAVLAVRSAYLAVNAATYQQAVFEARAAIADLLAVSNGDDP